MAGGCAIAVMAKAPRAGAVKTRLVPPLTPDQARELNARFLMDMLGNIELAGRDLPISGYLAFAPAGTERLFDGIARPETGFVLADGSDGAGDNVSGFGRSLLHAVRGLFALGHRAVCLLNSDSPTLPTDCLRRAVRALAAPGDQVVLGAAEDGGYYLIGMTKPVPHLFSGIDWSTSRVANQTRERVREAGLPLTELGSWYDVDDGRSLLRLADELQGSATGRANGGFSAPHTSAWLREREDVSAGWPAIQNGP